MRDYFEFLMKQLLSYSKNCNQTETVFEEIEEKQVKLSIPRKTEHLDRPS